MANFNKVFLMGNLTRDPQLKYLPSQTAVVEFGMACNRRWKTPTGEDKEEVTFVNCSAFGKQAETLNQYCQKGKQLFIEGRLKFDSWEDKNGGGKRSKLTVVIENFQFIGSREGAGGGGQGGGGGGGGSYDDGESAPPPQRSQQRSAPPQRRPAPQQQSPISDDPQISPDDIPF